MPGPREGVPAFLHSWYAHWRDSRESPGLPAKVLPFLCDHRNASRLPLHKLGTFLGRLRKQYKSFKSLSPQQRAVSTLAMSTALHGGQRAHLQKWGTEITGTSQPEGKEPTSPETILMAVLSESIWPFLVKSRVVGPAREPRRLLAAHGYSSQLEGGGSQLHNPPFLNAVIIRIKAASGAGIIIS